MTTDCSYYINDNVLCPQCKNILPSFYPSPIDVTVTSKPGKAIIEPLNVHIDLYHKRFLDQIKNHLDGFIMGKCFDKKGRCLENYMTCYTIHRIKTRGIYIPPSQFRYKRCDTCGNLGGISSVGAPIQYTLQQYLSDRKVYFDNYGHFYLVEELASQIDFTPWPDAVLEPILIKDKPEPGQEIPGEFDV